MPLTRAFTLSLVAVLLAVPPARAYSVVFVTKSVESITGDPLLSGAWRGLTDARDRLGVRLVNCVITDLMPDAAFQHLGDTHAGSRAFLADLPGQVRACLHRERPDLVVTAGFSDLFDLALPILGDFPGMRFLSVDAGVAAPNLRAVAFAADQPAVVVGFLAASLSKTGRVGAISGAPIDNVQRFIVGFRTGVNLAGKNVEVLETDLNFEFAAGPSYDATAAFLAAGADFVFPVNGNGPLGTAEAIADAGGTARMAGVDFDWYGALDSGLRGSVITSAMKDVARGTFAAVAEAVAGGPASGVFVANLGNGGVALAPFHGLPADPQLQAALDALVQGLLSGAVQTGWPPP